MPAFNVRDRIERSFGEAIEQVSIGDDVAFSISIYPQMDPGSGPGAPPLPYLFINVSMRSPLLDTPWITGTNIRLLDPDITDEEIVGLARSFVESLREQRSVVLKQSMAAVPPPGAPTPGLITPGR